MLRYIFFRILWLPPILLVCSFVIFFLLRASQIDPVMQYITASHLESTPELVASLREDFGLDKPIFTQYIAWLKDAVMLNFGASYISGKDVASEFFYYLPNTLALSIFAFIFMLLFCIPLGIISSVYKDRLPDFLVRFVCFFGVSSSSFWLAFLLIIVFSIKLGWLPALGLEGLKSFILPALSIAFMSACINTRIIRSNMLEMKKERHIIYAKARGLSSKKVTLKHIFYNALLPIVTSFGMHFGEIFGWALIIENIFVLPGIGLYSIQGFLNHDFPVIQCFIVSMCFMFVLCNLATDLLYALLDSRVIREYSFN